MTMYSIASENAHAALNHSLAPPPVAGRRQYTMLLCLALPLTFAVGCATNPNKSAGNYQAATMPALANAPLPAPRTANQVVGDQIYEMLLADHKSIYTLGTSVNAGVVTFRGPLTGGAGEQRMVDRISLMTGVNQVKDERGDLSTPGFARSR